MRENHRWLLTWSWFLLVCWFMVGVEARASEQMVREWKRDMEILTEKIFEPLARHFETENASAGWQDYIVLMLDELSTHQDAISASTLGILRDITLTLNQDFARIAPDRSWRDAAYYLRTKLNLVTRIMGYMQYDRR